MADFDASFWDRRYEGDDYVFGTEPNAWLVDHAAALPASGRALCVADGEGRNSVWLASRCLTVEAFDISPVGVEKARALATRAGAPVEYAVAGVDDFAWRAEAFDVVAGIFIQFAPPEQRAAMFQRMGESLRPGGVLLLLGYGLRQLEFGTGGPPVASHLYSTDLLREAFADLVIDELTSFEADVQEGPGHSGRSDLVGLVARRAG